MSYLWQPWEDELLQRYYPDKKILIAMLPRRKWLSIVWRARMTSFSYPHRRWTESEIKLLKQFDGRLNARAQAKMLHRSQSAVQQKRAVLGMSARSQTSSRARSPLVEDIRTKLAKSGQSIASAEKLIAGARLSQGQGSTGYSQIKTAMLAMKLGGEIYIEWQS